MRDAGEQKDEGNAPELVFDSTIETGIPQRALAGPGLIGSAFIHLLAVFLLVYRLTAPEPPLPILPVELVFLSEQANPVPEPKASPGPQSSAPAPRGKAPARTRVPSPAAELASLVPPVTPKAVEPAPDALQSKLDALAKLRAPSGDARLRQGASGIADGDGDESGRGGYTVRDYVRAQVERRWNLDLSELGARDLVIAIHVVLHRDGTITKAEIVDQGRFARDDLFHSVALSARNAVLLSSPVALPAGNYEEVMDMTLNLKPRDTLR